jgi:hypothetical protein
MAIRSGCGANQFPGGNCTRYSPVDFKAHCFDNCEGAWVSPALREGQENYILPSRMVPSALISYSFLFSVPTASGMDGFLVKT